MEAGPPFKVWSQGLVERWIIHYTQAVLFAPGVPIPTKYHQSILKSIVIMEPIEFYYPILQGKIMQKSEWELTFLYPTCFLGLFYIPSKHHQVTLKGTGVWKHTRYKYPKLQGQKKIKNFNSYLSYMQNANRTYPLKLQKVIKLFHRVLE